MDSSKCKLIHTNSFYYVDCNVILRSLTQILKKKESDLFSIKKLSKLHHI